jgi:hypothetical protein
MDNAIAGIFCQNMKMKQNMIKSYFSAQFFPLCSSWKDTFISVVSDKKL